MEDIKLLRRFHLKNRHNVTFYPYQELISDQIIEALVDNLIVTRESTEEQIKALEPQEVFAEFSRQSGKTTAVVLTIDFIMCYFPRIFNRRIEIGIFAPQKEQAKTDFDRLKEALLRDGPIAIPEEGEQIYREQSNATTLVLPNGASCYIFPVSPTTKPESKSLNLIIFEESQYLNDNIVQQQIWPMGANTNAPMVYLGTAGTQICYFYRQGQLDGSIKLYYDEIVKQRRKVYEETKDAMHLIYEQTVGKLIDKHGRDSDEIARPFFGKWLLGEGQFVTQEKLEALETDRALVHQDAKNECFAGIDTAKHPDSTVVTIIRYNKELKKKELINWLELRGENYKNQFDIIIAFLNKYNIQAIAMDATGQGSILVDFFADATQWQDEDTGLFPVKFNSQSKNDLFQNLKVSIEEALTNLPKISTTNSGRKELQRTNMGGRFKQQMLDLQQEYKIQGWLSVKHPDDPNAHDDYPDSWALAEWAYHMYKSDQPEIYTIDTSAKKRKVKKDEQGKVKDYWPEKEDVGWAI